MMNDNERPFKSTVTAMNEKANGGGMAVGTRRGLVWPLGPSRGESNT